MTPKDLVATPARQLGLAALGLVVILAALTAAYFLWLRTPYKVLFTDLRTADAATIVAELDKKKTPYRLADEGRTILVPGKLADGTRLSVMSQDLPLKGTVGFELFNKSDMGLTEFAQQINYRRALQGELARTIMALDGVESARVHLSLAEASAFREDRRPAKASVTLIARAGYSFTPRTIRGVQSLIAAAVTDLAIADVVVLDGQGAIITADAEPAPIVDPADDLAETYAQPIRVALGEAFPSRTLDVVVAVPAGAEQLNLDASANGSPDPLAPRPRLFGLSVRVLVDGVLTPKDRARIQQVTIAAGGLNPALGDALTVTALGAAPATSASAPEAKAPALATAQRSSSWIVSVLLAVLLAALLGLALTLQRRGPPSRAMSAAERKRYADRLSQLLAEEPERAAS